MRISDWSSDVCSSDLAAVADVTVLGVAGERHGHDGGISELFALALRAVEELHLDVVGRQRSERHHGLRPTVHADVGPGAVEVDVVAVHTLEPGPHPPLPRPQPPPPTDPPPDPPH